MKALEKFMTKHKLAGYGKKKEEEIEKEGQKEAEEHDLPEEEGEKIAEDHKEEEMKNPKKTAMTHIMKAMEILHKHD